MPATADCTSDASSVMGKIAADTDAPMANCNEDVHPEQAGQVSVWRVTNLRTGLDSPLNARAVLPLGHCLVSPGAVERDTGG